MPCANVGSRPWCRCGCTDDTPCRLGDTGSITFLPWFVPRTEPPVQIREVSPDRGHLLTESCIDVQHRVCRCRTGDEDCCCCGKPPPKYHCLYWRYICSVEGVAAACIAAAPGVAAARTAAFAAAAADVAAARGGGGQQEAIRPNRWWSRIV